MDTSVFPDWKKIGWHVGKRIRDILRPIPIESDESKKARKIRRLHDNSKGFVYFDDFETLHAWSADDIDPVQQANTPLLERQVAANGGELEKSTSILLCHDYRGGYHDYESVRPANLEFEMYSCEYLQYVNEFIYFSHKLVCVPPASWINTMHRNGVKILGTFLFEPQTPDIERVLEQVNGEFIVAKQLSCLAVDIGFDGWLLNFEKEFPKSCPNFATTLMEFISELRRLMGSQRSVIWYDALNIDNEVEYQNSLTSKNLDFAQSADALFTNYKWTEKDIREASILAAEHGIRSSTLFFGIDVWAQNTNMSGPPRITFPPKGGGGTNTGLAIEALLRGGFSAAIFAPAWPYEHFSAVLSPQPQNSQISIAKSVDQAMWEGSSLPDHLMCDCQEGRPHHTVTYRSHPITYHAREYAAGSSVFFHTRFQKAFTRVLAEDRNNSNPVISKLGSQDVLPHLLPVPAPVWEELGKMSCNRVIYGELMDGNDPYLRVMTKILGQRMDDHSRHSSWSRHHHTQDVKIMRLRLFNLNMPANDTLEACIYCERGRASNGVDVGLFVAYSSDESKEPIYRYQRANFTAVENSDEIKLSLHADNDKAHAVQLGAYFLGQIEAIEPLPLLDILSITIKPKLVDSRITTIEHIRTITRGQGTCKEKRLAWEWQGGRNTEIDGLPWSTTTGPFSHFIIMMANQELGSAYSLEFPLRENDYHAVGKNASDVDICVKGFLFGGGCVSSQTVIPATSLFSSD